MICEMICFTDINTDTAYEVFINGFNSKTEISTAEFSSLYYIPRNKFRLTLLKNVIHKKQVNVSN